MGRRAALELQLDLADRRLRSARRNRASIQSELDLRAGRRLQLPGGTLEVGHEYRCKLQRQLRVGKNRSGVRFAEHAVVQDLRRERGLDLFALVQTGVDSTGGFERLAPALTGASHAQRNLAFAQRELWRVVVDAVQTACRCAA